MNPSPNVYVNGKACLREAKASEGQHPVNTSLYINWLLRLAVGGSFVLAAGLKIVDPAKFAVDVGNYRLVPHELNNLVAIIVPWVEMVAGLAVIFGIWLRAAALVITGLTTMFFFVILSALARGLNMECGCFGTVGGQHVGLVNLAIDSTLFFLAITLVLRSKEGAKGIIFREAGAQVAASPNEASTGAS